jgi:putative transposase
MSTPNHRTAPGSSYFVTTKCWQGRTLFQVPEIAEVLLETLFTYRDRRAYLLHEFVIMPDHLHLILTPGPTTSLEKAIQLIKGGSSHRIHKARNQKSEIWQVGFYDWTIRDYNDWQTKVQYIHQNPVRAKLVDMPQQWRYSSANDKFTLDPIPGKYVSSGAKAQINATLTSGLKPRPPKEKNSAPLDTTAQALKPTITASANVGPKDPTPNSFFRATNP